MKNREQTERTLTKQPNKEEQGRTKKKEARQTMKNHREQRTKRKNTE